MQHVNCTLVGDRNVGKTSMSDIYLNNVSPGLYKPGPDGFILRSDLSSYPATVMVGGRRVEVNMWDTPGRADYNSRQLYEYSNTDIFLLVFSLIDRDSYTNVREKWIGELRHYRPGLPVVLVGTKLDLPADYVQVHISREEGQVLAKTIGAVCYLECSAVTHQNVEAVVDAAIWVVVIGSTELSTQWVTLNLVILVQLPAKLLLISTIQHSMGDLLKHVKICSTESEYLVTKSKKLSSRIRKWFIKRSANPYLGNLNRVTVMTHKWESISILLDRFICCMVAGEDILSFCAKVDWQTTTLSMFLPISCESTYSKFSQVTRDLDRVGDMVFNLLEAPATQRINETSKGKWSLRHIYQKFLRPTTQESQPENDYMEAEIITDDLGRHRSDREHILSKLENESSNPSSDLTIYGYLLRKRLQGDLHAKGTSLVLDCFWIPEKLHYDFQDVVGTGSSKTVLKCMWLGQLVAIAIYKVAKVQFEREAEVLARVQHPNVVNFIGCAYEEKDQKGYLVTELMEEDLQQLITKLRRRNAQMPFSVLVSMDIILQIVEAMIHMRKCRVSHRDLKPQNCLVTKKNSRLQKHLGITYYVVKLIDFGSSKLHGPDTSICYTRKQGSIAYMAPEVHRMKDDCEYTWSADVYSFGMTCYEIISGKCPFEGECSGGNLVKRVCAGERPQFSVRFPVFWKQLVEKCWHQIPERRPSFISIRKEIWECYDKLV